MRVTKQYKEESRYSTRSMVLIRSAKLQTGLEHALSVTHIPECAVSDVRRSALLIVDGEGRWYLPPLAMGGFCPQLKGYFINFNPISLLRLFITSLTKRCSSSFRNICPLLYPSEFP
ncbi:hypothetical protein J6590_019094 [Homalodisca vitripennis]|nr:hypothetical protein J6590_019094 [Homalodisca vitripennis]